MSRATHLSGLSVKPTAAVTAATLAVMESGYAGKVTVLDKADGQAVTLPKATGSGNKFTFFVKTTVTSDLTIKVANATDVLSGNCLVDGDSAALFPTAADSDTVTMNGTTSGGVAGSQLVVEDVASGVWMVNGVLNGSGVIVTPFSATVS